MGFLFSFFRTLFISNRAHLTILRSPITLRKPGSFVIITALTCLLLIAPVERAAAGFGELYPVNDTIVVTVTQVGKNGTSDEGATKEFTAAYPSLKIPSIRTRVVSYLKRSLPDDVRNNAAIVGPSEPAERPVGPDVLYLLVQYNMRYINIGDVRQAFLTMTVRPQYPLFDHADCLLCPEFWRTDSTSGGFPIVVMPFGAENVEAVLDEAIARSFEVITVNLCLSKNRAKSLNLSYKCIKEHE